MVYNVLLCAALAVVAAAHSGSLSSHVPAGVCSGLCPAQSKEALAFVQRRASMLPSMDQAMDSPVDITNEAEGQQKLEIAKLEKEFDEQKPFTEAVSIVQAFPDSTLIEAEKATWAGEYGLGPKTGLCGDWGLMRITDAATCKSGASALGLVFRASWDYATTQQAGCNRLDVSGDLQHKVFFNTATHNERSDFYTPICRYLSKAPTASPTPLPTATPTQDPTQAPTDNPTPSPTPAPTASPTTATPTQAPTSAEDTSTAATAVGDPHLVNTRGEHFSIFKSGQVEFIRVPWQSVTENADFTVHANIQSFNKTNTCERALYITGLLFGGSWFKGKPLEVKADSTRPGATRKEMKVLLGGVPVMPSTSPIDLGNKMALQMHDNNEILLMVDGASVAVDLQDFFLNVKADSFSRLSQKIGGLLGDDDHSAFSTKPARCEHSPLALAEAVQPVYSSARMSA